MIRKGKVMKKKITAVLAASMIIVSAASCGSQPAATTTTAATSAAPEEKISFTAKEVTEAVLAEIPIASAFEKNKDTLSDFFYDLDVDAVEDSSYYICASGAYPDEIAVFVMKDESAAKAAKSAVEKRLKEQSDTYETYTPDEFYKLEGAVVAQKGSCVYYLVTSDNSKAEEIVKTFIK